MSEQQGKGRVTLKTYFEADKMPREGHFADLIDASLNKIDDQLFISVEGEGENSARFLGIGSTDPQSPLSIRNRTGDAKRIGLEDTGGDEEWHISINPPDGHNGFLIGNNDKPDAVLLVSADGKTGIGTKSPEEQLHVEGNIRASGDITAQKFEGNLSWNFLTDRPNSLIPSGVIVMWSGIVDDIPEGWAICDGDNSTPDLRERFIVGAGGKNAQDNIEGPGYTPGNRGGSNKVHLGIEHLPSHSHTISDDGSHSHNFDTGRKNNNGSIPMKSGTHDLSRNAGRTSDNGNHNHGGITGYEGGNKSHENRPPYYALCFIMKL